MMEDEILREQVAYYGACAEEYDESIKKTGRYALAEPEAPAIEQELARAAEALYALEVVDEALELACGTGLWTRELLKVARCVTALDASPEMIALNKEKVNDERVAYRCVDLFEWEPDQPYDLVFFAFWLSHVPPARLDTFLAKVARAVRPGGHLFILDEPAQGQQLSGPVENGTYQRRRLFDGREFAIIKMYYEPRKITANLAQHGFETTGCTSGEYFFYLAATRLRSQAHPAK